MSIAACDPVVSVLVPVRNAGRYLDEALASLRCQTLSAIEIVVVDHSSTDGSAAIIARHAAEDDRIRAFRFDGRGLARCLNFAASKARAPLIGRLDADDVAHPDRLAIQVAAIGADPAIGLLGSRVTTIDASGVKIGEHDLPLEDGDIRAFMRRGCPFSHPSVIMRRDVFESVGGYRDGLSICEDYELWTRMAEVTRMRNLPQALTSYRLHDASMTFARPIRMLLADICIVAAIEARRRGEAEPFDRGRPLHRRALGILGLGRAQLTYRAFRSVSANARIVHEQRGRRAAWRMRKRALMLYWRLPVTTRLREATRLVALSFASGTRRRRRRRMAGLFALFQPIAKEPA